MVDTKTRVESELEVNSFLQNLRYALEHNAKVTFQAERLVDQNSNRRYTNQFTVADLFPDERYIKIRVELLSEFGDHMTFVMSFHYAEMPFSPDMFPYRKRQGGISL